MARKVRLTEEREQPTPAPVANPKPVNITINSASIPPLPTEQQARLLAMVEYAAQQMARNIDSSLRGAQWAQFRESMRAATREAVSSQQAAAGMQALGRAIRNQRAMPVEIDTQSYAAVRRMINSGTLSPDPSSSEEE